MSSTLEPEIILKQTRSTAAPFFKVVHSKDPNRFTKLNANAPGRASLAGEFPNAAVYSTWVIWDRLFDTALCRVVDLRFLRQAFFWNQKINTYLNPVTRGKIGLNFNVIT